MYPARLVALALSSLIACGGAVPSARPDERPEAARARALAAAPSGTTSAVAHPEPRPVDPSLITHGTRAALFARSAAPPAAPACAKGERHELTFAHVPLYSAKVEKDGAFSARLFVGNDAPCTRQIAVSLSFTPPKMTTTRTVDFAAYLAPRGGFVDLRLEPTELAEVEVTPGRYAITFAVLDEEGQAVGRALAGNPFRLGRDDVSIAAAPPIPAHIGRSEELVVPFSVENVGDTANHVIPLIVFTRPGETQGIEHYEPPQLVLPGASTLTVRLSQQAREAEGIAPGSWLVTVTMFDAAGDRVNSFYGMPLTIGTIDIRMTRPELPTRVPASAPLRAVFKLENRGDTADKVKTVLSFTKPGTTASHELVFTRDALPGPLVFEAVVDRATLHAKGVDGGVWLVSVAAFRSSGERIKSFTGHYLEIQ